MDDPGSEPVRQGGEPRRADRSATPRATRSATSTCHDLAARRLRRAHTRATSRTCSPTDTQKNTAFAYAKIHGVTSPEDYAMALGGRLMEAAPAASAAQVRVEEYAWDAARARPLLRTSRRRGPHLRGAPSAATGPTWSPASTTWCCSSPPTRSSRASWDEFTTLAETDDRILATSLVARWRHDGTADSTGTRRTTRCATCLLSTFATTYSPRPAGDPATLMGSAVLDTQPGIAEIRFSAPNKHHFLVDFSAFEIESLTNDGEVFFAADRPYGLIEAQVTRDDASRRTMRGWPCRGSACRWTPPAEVAAGLPGRAALGRRRAGRAALRRPAWR